MYHKHRNNHVVLLTSMFYQTLPIGGFRWRQRTLIFCSCVKKLVRLICNCARYPAKRCILSLSLISREADEGRYLQEEACLSLKFLLLSMYVVWCSRYLEAYGMHWKRRKRGGVGRRWRQIHRNLNLSLNLWELGLCLVSEYQIVWLSK